VIRYVLVRVVLGCTASGLALVAVSLTSARVLDVPSPGAEEVVVTDPRSAQAADRVARLLALHDCWSASAPADAPIPDHAVVTLPDQRPRLVAADVGYGIWLDGDAGVLHGFCP
jgi:hypothetical protein